jgi:L-lactate dehydrogenase complex protein LldG
MTTTRDAFLAKIRAAQPAGRPRPDVPLFDTPPGARLERFRAALAAMGGTVVEGESLESVRTLLHERLALTR